MLYITTRDENNVYTACRTLNEERGANGGYFVPFQLPKLDREAIQRLKENSFGQNVADILDLLFSARLDAWDVDFCIGRYPTKLVAMSHRIVFAETWHNPDMDFARIVRNLTSRIRGIEDTADPVNQPANWAWIAVRIAVLFGVFGDLARVNMADVDHPVDVAVPTGDFSLPMAAWYAREMGLPICNIICGCNENGVVWDFLHHGELHTAARVVETATPEGDMVVPPHLERLIYGTLGSQETTRFLDACAKAEDYRLSQILLENMRQGVYAGVVSDPRMEQIIRSMYNTSTYIMDPYSALAYCSLQDYRTRYAEYRTTLVLSERSPIRFSQTVCKALGITRDDLRDRLNLS